MSAINLLFQTQDTPLAITLLTIGAKVPMHPEQKLPMPFINLYDATILRRLGYGGANWTLETAARDAWKTGKPGNIWYNFERSETLERAVEAWGKQGDLIREQASLTGTGGQRIAECKLDLAEAVRFARQLFSNRKQTIEDWKIVTPFILLPGESHTDTETDAKGNAVTVTIGSFRGYFLDCVTPADRTHLGV